MIFGVMVHTYALWYVALYILASLPTVARVGLERTFFSVSEDGDVVELCARVYEPDIECPIAFPFDVRLSTSDNTAGNSNDHANFMQYELFSYHGYIYNYSHQASCCD